MIARRPQFPGMDPWLEHPDLWPDVHNRLIASIADALSEKLRPRYFVGVEEHAYLWTPTVLDRLIVPDLAVLGPTPGRPRPGGA